jgi:cell division protein FtsL
MTPPAVTPAGRGSASKSRRPPRSGDGHRGTIRQQPAPKAPRRVSGPLGGRGAGGGTARAAAASTARARGATIKVPARTDRRAGPSRQAAAMPARALAFVRALPDHALIDRLVRGRAWIPVLGVMLAGIVAMQVSILKLNASIGRSIERGTALQSQNQQLRAAVATLADDQRIERVAAGTGMVMPAPAAVGFLSGQPAGGTGQAVANIKPPDSAGFLASLPAATQTDPLTGLSASAGTGTSSAISGSALSGAGSATSVGSGTGSVGAAGAATSSPAAPAGSGVSSTAGGAAPASGGTAQVAASPGSSGSGSGSSPSSGSAASPAGGAGVAVAPAAPASAGALSGGGAGIQSQSSGTSGG